MQARHGWGERGCMQPCMWSLAASMAAMQPCSRACGPWPHAWQPCSRACSPWPHAWQPCSHAAAHVVPCRMHRSHVAMQPHMWSLGACTAATQPCSRACGRWPHAWKLHGHAAACAQMEHIAAFTCSPTTLALPDMCVGGGQGMVDVVSEFGVVIDVGNTEIMVVGQPMILPTFKLSGKELLGTDSFKY
eukprot:361474-Chlamydomonas_euryale.AAC.3